MIELAKTLGSIIGYLLVVFPIIILAILTIRGLFLLNLRIIRYTENKVNSSKLQRKHKVNGNDK
jgi:hypothetical protein